MGASVVAHGDAPPVFEPSEHVFDFMPLLVQDTIIFVLHFAVFLRRDAGHDAPFDQGRPEPVGIIAAIGKQFVCSWQSVQQCRRTCIIADLSCRKMQQNGLACTVGHGMKF